MIADDYEVLGLASVNFREILASISLVLFSLVLAWRSGSAVDYFFDLEVLRDGLKTTIGTKRLFEVSSL